MQQPQEAAPEAKTKSVGTFFHARDTGIIERQFAHGLVKEVKLRGIDGVYAYRSVEL
jgi:hypothetical protein